MDKGFMCEIEGCHKIYGSDAAKQKHMVHKHNALTKTEKERRRKHMVVTSQGGMRSIMTTSNRYSGSVDMMSEE